MFLAVRQITPTMMTSIRGIVTIYTFLILHTTVSGCLYNCTSTVYQSTHQDCESSGFTRIPVHTDIVSLSVVGNRITKLRENELMQFPLLDNLDASDNFISEIHPRAFNGVDQLQTLYLHINQLETLPGDVFSSLSELYYLDLSSNVLSTLANTTFSGLVGLTTLSLSNNQLTGLERMYLDDMSLLMTLKLEDNLVETFSGNVLDSLPRLSQLYLQNNPLQCDCRLLDLLAWSDRPVNSLFGAVCDSPPNLSGRSLNQLSEDDLICISPRIDDHSNDVTAMAGTMVELFCNASGQPDPVITWSTPQGLYIPPNHDKDGKFTSYENGSLLISDVDYTDDGIYTCIAANVEGGSSVDIALTVVGWISSTREPTVESSSISPVSQCDATGQILGTFFGTFFGTLLLCALIFYVWYSRQNDKIETPRCCKMFNKADTVQSTPSTSPIVHRQRNQDSLYVGTPGTTPSTAPTTTHDHRLPAYPLRADTSANNPPSNTVIPSIQITPEYFEIIPDDNPPMTSVNRNSAPAGTCNPGYDYPYEIPERERRYTALIKDDEEGVEAIYQTLDDQVGGAKAEANVSDDNTWTSNENRSGYECV